jgi:hypothetical protein
LFVAIAQSVPYATGANESATVENERLLALRLFVIRQTAIVHCLSSIVHKATGASESATVENERLLALRLFVIRQIAIVHHPAGRTNVYLLLRPQRLSLAMR